MKEEFVENRIVNPFQTINSENIVIPFKSRLNRGMDPLHVDAQFLVPDWGDKVDYGLGLSYRPASLLAGRYDNPVPKSTLSP
jgi:hypothetical protein